jgi:hypothetical protein
MKTIIALFIGASVSLSSFALDEVLVEGGSKSKDKSGEEVKRLQRRLAPDDSLQGVEGQLGGLYAQRDVIVKGLHDLAYDVCMKSRIGTVDKLMEHLSGKINRRQVANQRRIGMVWDCPLNAKCEPPSFDDKKLRVVLPLLNQPHMYKTEFKKTQILERLLKFEGRRDKSTSQKRLVREQGKKIGFHRNFFIRNSCLAGPGIERACKLLSGEGKFKDSRLKRLSALMEKNPAFKLRFNKDLACEVSKSKKDYIEKLKPVQEAIVEFENKLKKARKGIDDDGSLVCEENDAGNEVCKLVYKDVSPEEPPIANHPREDEQPPIANHPREPASDDLTCRRASGTSTEFCFDSKQNRFKCEWDNGKRYCNPY